MTSRVFRDDDYSSESGMSTFVWGPALWHVLHTISFNYPNDPTEQDKRKYVRFMQSLGEILPCRYCRENLPDNLRAVGFCSSDMDSRASFSNLIYRLHREVNRRLGKPNTMSYAEVRDRYEHFRARNCTPAAAAAPATTTEQGCDTGIDQPKQRCIIRIDHRSDPQETLTVNPTCCARRVANKK